MASRSAFSLDESRHYATIIFATLGEVSERFMELVLKTSDS